MAVVKTLVVFKRGILWINKWPSCFYSATTRKKDGKEHRYWSIVENRRLSDGRVIQRHVLYLGEINAS